jgi:hypothetical protein
MRKNRAGPGVPEPAFILLARAAVAGPGGAGGGPGVAGRTLARMLEIGDGNSSSPPVSWIVILDDSA